MKLSEMGSKKKPAEKEKPYKDRKVSIFEIIDALTVKKTELNFEDESVSKAYDQYMINRWLSMDESLFPFIEEVNMMQNLSDQQHCDLLRSTLPQRKFYIKYIKRKRELSEKDMRYVAHYFEAGLRDAHQYMLQMDDEEIQNILDKYKYGNGQMIQV